MRCEIELDSREFGELLIEHNSEERETAKIDLVQLLTLLYLSLFRWLASEAFGVRLRTGEPRGSELFEVDNFLFDFVAACNTWELSD